MTNAAGYRQVADLRAKLAAIASGQAAREVRQAIAAEWLRLVEDEFRAQAEPTGQPWAPKERPGGRILVKSGRLRAGWRARSTPTGVVLENPAPYAAVHQYGSLRRGIPARSMVPVRGRPLPNRWRVGAEVATSRILKHYLP